jgi:hypothetical protein
MRISLSPRWSGSESRASLQCLSCRYSHTIAPKMKKRCVIFPRTALCCVSGDARARGGAAYAHNKNINDSAPLSPKTAALGVCDLSGHNKRGHVTFDFSACTAACRGKKCMYINWSHARRINKNTFMCARSLSLWNMIIQEMSYKRNTPGTCSINLPNHDQSLTRRRTWQQKITLHVKFMFINITLVYS